MVPQKQNILFYIGIDGERIGPLDIEEVKKKIAEKSIKRSDLIWYDGLIDWVPIDTIEYFREDLTSTEQTQNQKLPVKQKKALSPQLKIVPPRKETNIEQKSEENPVQKKIHELAMAPTKVDLKAPEPPEALRHYPINDNTGKILEPIFSKHESVFENSIKYNNQKKLIFLRNIFVLLFSIFLIKVVYSNLTRPLKEDLEQNKQLQKQLAANTERLKIVRESINNFIKQPIDSSKNALTHLVIEDHQDQVGKEGVQVLTDYFKSKGEWDALGDFYIQLGDPYQASEYFSKDPKLAGKTKLALIDTLNTSFSKLQVEQKKHVLSQLIYTLATLLDQTEEAKKYIALYQRLFPGDHGNFEYYSLPDDKKIALIFNKISFHFVKELMSYLKVEFPELRFLDEPRVQLVKNKFNRYRIVCEYNGSIKLTQDVLSHIHMVFWLTKKASWKLVATNLTPERKKLAEKLHSQYLNDDENEKDILKFLERIYALEFSDLELSGALMGKKK